MNPKRIGFFVLDLLEVKEKGGKIREGARQRIDVMLKDSKQFEIKDNQESVGVVESILFQPLSM
jgi:hypothetical protein